MAEIETTEALCSLEDINRALHIEPSSKEDDTEKIRLAIDVSAFFEQFCHRRFLSDTYVHDGTTLPRIQPKTPTLLLLENPPVTSITSLVDYSGGSTISAVAPGAGSGGGYVLNNDTGVVKLDGVAFSFPQFQSVECTYVGGLVADSWSDAAQLKRWGYNTAGADIRRAAAKYAAWLYRTGTRDLDMVASFSVGGTTTTYKDDKDLYFVQQTLLRRRRITP